MHLGELRLVVERARRDGGPPLAAALVALAEQEPLFAHRADVVRPLLTEAAQALTAHPDARLQARVLLRLAELQMVASDLELAERALERAGATCEDEDLRLIGAIRACRVAIRRGERDQPASLLVGVATHVESPSPDVAVELALAVAELEADAADSDADGIAALGELANHDRPDVAFVANQLLAAHALSTGQVEVAIRSLRAVLKLVTTHASAEDEVEARLALAGALVARGDTIGLEEATRHVQAARQRAAGENLEDAYVASLIGQAGVLVQRGKIGQAIDRCIEIAKIGAREGDAQRLVAAVGLMAEIYAQTGDFASAYRTIAEAHHGLRDATKVDVEPLFRPLLAALRDKMGESKFKHLVEDVRQARLLADSMSDPRRH
jgi:tetratricopeptide (TPR) repeat protein